MKADRKSIARQLVLWFVIVGSLMILGCSGDDDGDGNFVAVTVDNAQNTIGERTFTIEDSAAIDPDFAGQMGTLTFGPFNMDSDGDGNADTAAFSLILANERAGGTITVGNSCTITIMFQTDAGVEGEVDPPEVSVADPCDVDEGDGTLQLTIENDVFTFTSPAAVTDVFNQDVDLSPANEVEPSVDLDGRLETGAASLRLLSGDILVYTITINDVQADDMLTNAHIHPGNAAENGGVLTTLVNQPAQFGRTTNIVFPTPANGVVAVTGSIALTADEATRLADEAEPFYINAHSSQAASGLVRGQLRQNVVLAFNTPLSGANEIPPTGRGETGFATLRLLDDDTLVYALTVDNLLAGDALTNAHIHMGNSAENGPVFITLVNQPVQDGRTTDIQFDGTSVNASISLTADEIAAVTDPDQPLYVNIHSEQLGGGVTRGQLRDGDIANQAPTANAGEDQTIPLGAGLEVEALLDGSASLDPDGTVAAFTWTAMTAGSPDPDDVDAPTVSLGAGTHTFSLVVTDDDGANSVADEVTIIIEVSFADHIQPILTQNCATAGCHVGPTPPPNSKPLNLEAGQAYANLVGVASGQMPLLNRVEPGDPDLSYLFKKHRGDADIGGNRMPLTNPSFFDDNPDLLDLEEEWIRQGALNN